MHSQPTEVPPTTNKEASLSLVISTNPFAGWLLRYYWVPVLVYVLISIYYGITQDSWYSHFQWSFVPAQLVGFGLACHLICRMTPRLFDTLVSSGVLTEENAQEERARLSRRLSGYPCEIFSGLFAAPFFVFSLSDTLMAYLLGQIIWKGVVIGWTIHGIGSGGKLRLRPFHHDGCAGLSSIGEICLGGSMVLVAFATFLSFWLVYVAWINPAFSADPLFKTALPFFYVGLAIVALCSILVFFLPMWSTHRLMSKRAGELEARYLEIANELADREERLLEQGPSMDGNIFSSEFDRIQTLRSIIDRGKRVPRWPIPVQTKVHFAAAQFPGAIGLVASMQQLSSFTVDTLKP